MDHVQMFAASDYGEIDIISTMVYRRSILFELASLVYFV